MTANPRLAALAAAEHAWPGKSEAMQEASECFCHCTFPEGEYVTWTDDGYEPCDSDGPDAEWCDCFCHEDVRAAQRALTDDDRAEDEARRRAGMERLRAAFQASGATTFGELVALYPDGLP